MLVDRPDHSGWLVVEHRLEDEDLLRDAVADVMGESRGGVDIWVWPAAGRLQEWCLGSVGLAERDEPSLDDLDDELLKPGDTIEFFFRDPAEARSSRHGGRSRIRTSRWNLRPESVRKRWPATDAPRQRKLNSRPSWQSVSRSGVPRRTPRAGRSCPPPGARRHPRP